MSKTNVLEIFSSVQGEGKFVGYRQIFVRLAECNLKCEYCDTNFKRSDFCNVETFAGSGKFRPEKNPLDSATVAETIKNFNSQVPAHSISFTGGEPLLNPEFIRDVAKSLKNFPPKIFLETNGTLFEEFEKISEVVDIVSADIKFPGIVGKNLFDRHKKFLKVARKKDLYVKTVISEETTEEEFLNAVNLIEETDPEILLVIQPVTPVGKIRAAAAEKILHFQAVALRKLKDVRVIPQTHKIINLL